MKSHLSSLLLIVATPILLSSSTHVATRGSSSYDVVCVYEKIELESGAKSLDSYGNIKDAKAVFVPTEIDRDKYTVELTRIDSNFYQICGTSLYVETRYCYEYAIRDDAILNITSNYGYTRGEVIFLD